MQSPRFGAQSLEGQNFLRSVSILHPPLHPLSSSSFFFLRPPQKKKKKKVKIGKKDAKEARRRQLAFMVEKEKEADRKHAERAQRRAEAFERLQIALKAQEALEAQQASTTPRGRVRPEPGSTPAAEPDLRKMVKRRRSPSRMTDDGEETEWRLKGSGGVRGRITKAEKFKKLRERSRSRKERNTAKKQKLNV